MLFRNLLCMFLLSVIAFGQVTDSTIVLKEVEVFSPRFDKHLTGFKSQKIDSVQLNDNHAFSVSDLLQRNSNAFIKSYGLGSLSSISLNGTGSSNTAVLWNGFNLQSPMLGLTDFALLPAIFIDELNIQQGGTVALFGGGATGGSIHLNTLPKYNKGLDLFSQQTFGSFDTKQFALGVSYGNKFFYSSVKWFTTSAENDMPFYNTALIDKPLQNMENARLKNNGLMAEQGFKLGRFHTLTFKYWYMYSDREIPPTLTSGYSLSRQKDQAHRSSVEWKILKNNWQLNTRAAWLNEFIFYTDPLILLDSRSFSDVLIAETEFSINAWKNHRFNVGINNTYAKATSNEYDTSHYSNRASAFASYRVSALKQKLFFNISARQELSRGDHQYTYVAVPLVYAAGMECFLVKQLKINGSFSKNYRLPTINDLYWVPGGNKKLKPEEGYTQVAGLLLSIIKNKFEISLDVSAHHSDINNWIMWTPVSATVWTPFNANRVEARGIDVALKTKVHVGNIVVGLNGGFNYTSSVNTKTYSVGDPSLHKQLIYVPLTKGYANVSVEYHSLKCIVFNEFTGIRYISTDNVYYLNPYELCGVTLQYGIKFSECTIDLFAKCDNLLNRQYQLMAWRPMPLRNYQGGLRISFHSPVNKKHKSYEN